MDIASRAGEGSSTGTAEVARTVFKIKQRAELAGASRVADAEEEGLKDSARLLGRRGTAVTRSAPPASLPRPCVCLRRHILAACIVGVDVREVRNHTERKRQPLRELLRVPSHICVLPRRLGGGLLVRLTALRALANASLQSCLSLLLG